jgi:hypothetical protein
MNLVQKAVGQNGKISPLTIPADITGATGVGLTLKAAAEKLTALGLTAEEIAVIQG